VRSAGAVPRPENTGAFMLSVTGAIATLFSEWSLRPDVQ
jgi:hypothetical protein